MHLRIQLALLHMYPKPVQAGAMFSFFLPENIGHTIELKLSKSNCLGGTGQKNLYYYSERGRPGADWGTGSLMLVGVLLEKGKCAQYLQVKEVGCQVHYYRRGDA